MEMTRDKIDIELEKMNKNYNLKVSCLHFAGYTDLPMDHHILFHNNLRKPYFDICEKFAGDVATEYFRLLEISDKMMLDT